MFIYLEMPKFNKTESELETRYDKWLYVIKNLNKLDRIPDSLRETIFLKLFETAEIAMFTPEEFQSYEDSLKYYRDIKNSLETARQEGREEGITAERKQIAKSAIEEGLSDEITIRLTGLTIDEIKRLRN